MQAKKFSKTSIIQTIHFYSTRNGALKRHHTPQRQECTPTVERGSKRGDTDRADRKTKQQTNRTPKIIHQILLEVLH